MWITTYPRGVITIQRRSSGSPDIHYPVTAIPPSAITATRLPARRAVVEDVSTAILTCIVAAHLNNQSSAQLVFKRKPADLN